MRSLSRRRVLLSITFWFFVFLIGFVVWNFLTNDPRFSPWTGFAIGAASLLLGFLIHYAKHPASDAPISDALKYTPTPKQQKRNRETMLIQVENFWVKGVLEQSRPGPDTIEVEMKEKPKAVERPWNMILQSSKEDRKRPHAKKIMDVYDEMGPSLLILGEPGSGKTIILLELAREMLVCAKNDPTHPIPVVFNLSSWSENNSISDWLVKELNSKYYIPKKIGRYWVENNELLLLLDGFDEVKQEYIENCCKAINDFQQKHLIPIVVCSRIAAYETLSTRFKLQSAVVLQPLTPEQINRYLDGIGIELLAVRRTLQYDVTLQELAQLPLMLSVMTKAYEGKSVQDLQSFDTLETRREHIFNSYIEQMFKHRKRQKNTVPDQVIVARLIWLAKKMIKSNQAIFLIEGLQPSWLERLNQRLEYFFINGVVSVLISGVLIGIAHILESGYLAIFAYGSLFGILPMLSHDIELFKLNWTSISGKLMKEFIISGVIFGLVMGLGRGLATESGGGLILELASWISIGLVSGIGFGLAYAFSPPDTISPPEVRMMRSSNVRIRQAAKSAVYTAIGAGLFFGLQAGLFVGLFEGKFFWLKYELLGYCLFGGIMFMYFMNGSSILKHYILRFILWHTGQLPWNLGRFFDYATEHVLLYKVGGGYIFIHRLLQEHFARLEEGQ